MTPPTHDANELKRIYSERFNDHIAYRNQVWKVLTSHFFSRFVSPEDRVLELGCGYGEFINNIACGSKIAIDLNPGARERLQAGVQFLEQDCTLPWGIPAESVDVIFSSNFFEHLPSKRALSDTLTQAHRSLRKGGTIIALGPNARFVGGAYWDFWDHHLPLTDNSMAEALRVHGFEVEESLPRFLPYTMVNRRRFSRFAVVLYLELPIAWKIFGKQFLVVGRK